MNNGRRARRGPSSPSAGGGVMATPPIITHEVGRMTAARHRRSLIPERMQSFLLLLPSFVAIAIFVYVFIALSFYVSISNWRTLKVDMSVRTPPYATYTELFMLPRFQSDFRNTVVFTIGFIVLASMLGLFL